MSERRNTSPNYSGKNHFFLDNCCINTTFFSKGNIDVGGSDRFVCIFGLCFA